MYMNFTSSGERFNYGISIIPGQPMESSAIPPEHLIRTTIVIKEDTPEVKVAETDWKSILPKEIPGLQPA